jgi:hypothetical protein
MIRCIHGVFFVADKSNKTLNSACSICRSANFDARAASRHREVYAARLVPEIEDDGITETDTEIDAESEDSEEVFDDSGT